MSPLFRCFSGSLTVRFASSAVLVAAALTACGDDDETEDGAGGATSTTTSSAATGPAFTAPDREWGDRTPLTDVCDDVNTERCLMPWPNDAFTVADPGTATGLRLSVDIHRMNVDDDPTVFSRADGFSRVSPIVVSFAEPIDPASAGAIHLYLAEKDAPDVGAEVPLRTEVVVPVDPEGETVLVADPRVPLEADSTYVVVVDDTLRDTAGTPVVPSHFTQVALGTNPAASQEEANLFGHHAPMRQVLGAIGFDVTRAVRAWDFTTRSAEDPRKRLRTAREAAIAAVDDGDVEVAIDTVETPDSPNVAAIVLGRLVGLPNFVDDDLALHIDDDGNARAEGTREAPFRVVIPRGEGDYRMLMFGHGTGGSVDDTSFDEAIAEAGAAKVSFELYGWTGRTVVTTFVTLQDIGIGGERAAGGLVQGIADGSAIRRAMSSVIGDALAAEDLGGAPNPHAGRRPDDSIPVWVGGSLGGTMGLLFTAANDDMDYAVLNVPGAAWTSWVRQAAQFRFIEPFLSRKNGGPQAVPLAVAMGQTFFDEADGAAWVDVLQGEHPVVALAQESIGDPVLPNAGTEMVAHVLGAKLVGEPLVRIEGIDEAVEVAGASALTQYWVSEDPDDEYAVHGFAAKDTPAAAAATEQVIDFVESVWAGEPLITVPGGCNDGACDFRE